MDVNEIIMEISKMRFRHASCRCAFMVTPEEHKALSLHFSDGNEECLTYLKICGIPIVQHPLTQQA
jgi:hypothetical protein